MEKGPTTGGEIGQGILLVLLTRSQDGENTFHEATAALTLRAITGLTPLYRMPQCALRTIVRLGNVWQSHEGP